MSDNEVFKNGYEACLKNADLWLNEGNMLRAHTNYPIDFENIPLEFSHRIRMLRRTPT